MLNEFKRAPMYFSQGVMRGDLKHSAPTPPPSAPPAANEAILTGRWAAACFLFQDPWQQANCAQEFLHPRHRVKREICSLESCKHRVVNATLGPVSKKEERGGTSELTFVGNSLGARPNVTWSSHLTLLGQGLSFQFWMNSYREFKDLLSCLSSTVWNVLRTLAGPS